MNLNKDVNNCNSIESNSLNYKLNNIFQEIINNQDLYLYIINPTTYKLEYFSDIIYKKSSDIKIGDYCYSSIMNKDMPCENCIIRGLNEEQKKYSIDLKNEATNEWINITASKIELESNNLVLICHKNIDKYVNKTIYIDNLTQVSTLDKFKMDLKSIIETNSNEKFVIVSTDFNKFKVINNNYGYEIGNEILRSFSALIISLINENELMCRAMDDKFLLVLNFKKEEDIKQKLKYFKEKVEEHARVYYEKYNITTVSGIYIIKEEDKDIQEIIDRANIARKKVKGCTGINYAYYNENMHNAAINESKIEGRMLYAIENDEFMIYLQPKVNLLTRKVIGAEVLVRWKINDGHLIPPMDFIPLFEKNGFIIKMDFYIYEKLFERMRIWLDSGKEVMPISVNVSRTQLNNPNFVSRFWGLVNQYNIPTHLIELELTESIFIDDTEKLVALMSKLKELGFSLSIDDFGSGYSSLNLLKELPVDILKLDKEFFKHGLIDSREKTVVYHVISMAKALNLIVLSEGVETEEQVQFLLEYGCDLAQGYLFARPMPIDEFEKRVFS